MLRYQPPKSSVWGHSLQTSHRSLLTPSQFESLLQFRRVRQVLHIGLCRVNPRYLKPLAG